jgi:hypothetical protein
MVIASDADADLPPNVPPPHVFDHLGTLAQGGTRSMKGVTWLFPISAFEGNHPDHDPCSGLASSTFLSR